MPTLLGDLSRIKAGQKTNSIRNFMIGWPLFVIMPVDIPARIDGVSAAYFERDG